jgi:GT2 family glycosyltransferase
VIGNYNGESVLTDCIDSLSAQILEPHAVLIVDGALEDGSVRLADELGVRCLQRKNLGLGHLYNEGAGATSAAYIFFANNDIAAGPTCLEELSAAVMADAETFAADARQLDWAGVRTIHARTTLSRGRMFREHLSGLHIDSVVETDQTSTTVCANGAAMLVRRSMFVELEGFDETFFMDWADLDICWRAGMQGWRTLYVPAAIVRHRVGAVTTSAARPRRSASSHHNLVRFALKCLPRGGAARVVAGGLVRLPVHPRSVASGLGAVTRELPEILNARARTDPSREPLDSMLSSDS